MISTMKPAISREAFEEHTPIMPDVIAETVLDRRQHNLDADAQKWFIEHADLRVRFMFTNDKKWKRRLKGEQCREFTYMFVNHWADAYLKSPALYRERHPNSYMEQ